MGVSIERYDFSEPKSGKDVCDRILSPMKGAIRRYCNEGHDILTARDMRTALKERPVQGCTAAVCQVNESQKELEVRKALRVWKAFQVGPGKLIPWDDIYVVHQRATKLLIEEENFDFTSRKIRGILNDSSDPGCARTFNSVEDMELHVSVGQHTESVYDKLKRDWVEKFSSLTIIEARSETTTTERGSGEPSPSDLSQGWALHKPKGGAGQFPDKIRQYLTSKFDIGVQSGRKEDPGQVAHDMRKAKAENGDRLFSGEEWLTKSQIQGFFSRLSSSRKRKTSPVPNTGGDDIDEDCLDQEDLDHMNTVQTVLKEIGLSHPIFSDIYDLCDYARNEKLSSFTVSMLKVICTFYDVSFKSRDTKAVLVSKVKEITSECPCSTGDA